MELISKDDVIKALQKWNCRDSESLTINPYEVLRDLPTIEERKEGEWIDDDEINEELDTYLANCSQCGYQMDVHNNRGYFNFCPNCGARMF